MYRIYRLIQQFFRKFFLWKLFFWQQLFRFRFRKLQQYRFTGHCRILTPEGVREALGGREEMEEAFKKIRDTLR